MAWTWAWFIYLYDYLILGWCILLRLCNN
jgi:hypothetical protein